MINAFKKTLTYKMMMGAIIVALFYQLIFTIVWMTGYSSIPNNLNKLTIAVVNDDPYFSESLMDITNNLPFNVKYMEKIESAQEQLGTREIHMIMHVPERFTSNVSQMDMVANINYIINDSNPAMVVAAMDKIQEAISLGLNQNIGMTMLEGTLAGLQVPSEQIKEIITGLSKRVDANVSHINPTGDMATQMLPLMLALVSFVSAMIFNMNMDKALKEVCINRWQSFVVGKLHQIIFSLVISLIATFVLFNMTRLNIGFISLWLFQALSMFVCFQFTYISVLLFGEIGMLLNVTFIVIQPIAVGFTIPLVSLSPFYRNIAKITPMHYAVTEIRNLLFGGNDHMEQIMALIAVGVVSLLICVLVVEIKWILAGKPAQEIAFEE